MLGRMMHLGYEGWIRKNVTSDFEHQTILAAKEFYAQLKSGEEFPKLHTPHRDWQTIVLPPGWVKDGQKFVHKEKGLNMRTSETFLAKAFEMLGEKSMKKWCADNDFLDVDKDIQKAWSYLSGDQEPSKSYACVLDLNITRKFARPPIVQSAIATAKRVKDAAKNRKKPKKGTSADVFSSPEGSVKIPASSPKFGAASSSSGAPASSASGVPHKVRLQLHMWARLSSTTEASRGKPG